MAFNQLLRPSLWLTSVGEIWNRGMLLKVIYQSCIFVKMLGGNRQEMLGGNNFHPASRCYPTHWKLTMYSSLSEHEAQPRFHNCQNSLYGTGTALKQIPITECQVELHPLSRTIENTSYHGRWPTCNPPELYTYVRSVAFNLRLAPALLINGPIVPWSLDLLQ